MPVLCPWMYNKNVPGTFWVLRILSWLDKVANVYMHYCHLLDWRFRTGSVFVNISNIASYTTFPGFSWFIAGFVLSMKSNSDLPHDKIYAPPTLSSLVVTVTLPSALFWALDLPDSPRNWTAGPKIATSPYMGMWWRSHPKLLVEKNLHTTT